MRQQPYLAVYCIICRRDELLFMRRFNTGNADGFWSVRSGHVDGDESATLAASRVFGVRLDKLIRQTGCICRKLPWRR